MYTLNLKIAAQSLPPVFFQHRKAGTGNNKEILIKFNLQVFVDITNINELPGSVVGVPSVVYSIFVLLTSYLYSNIRSGTLSRVSLPSCGWVGGCSTCENIVNDDCTVLIMP
jgi:hypothetical protein